MTLLDINNSVPADMYNEEIKDNYDYTQKDTFMGFHCGNTAKSKLSFCEMKYQRSWQDITGRSDTGNIRR